MQITRRKLYLFLLVSILIGYIWLIANLLKYSSNDNEGLSFCFIKQTANIPCPSCGSTRSIVAFLNGNIIESLYWNPIGLIMLFLLIIIPFWLLFDVTFNKQTLLNFYLKAEITIRKPSFAVIAILLIIINWIWNILKGL